MKTQLSFAQIQIAAHPFCRVSQSFSESGLNAKGPDNDRISSDIVRIISPENSGLTRVISETYDFFTAIRTTKFPFLIVPERCPPRPPLVANLPHQL
jgi:hypothetical protein